VEVVDGGGEGAGVCDVVLWFGPHQIVGEIDVSLRAGGNKPVMF